MGADALDRQFADLPIAIGRIAQADDSPAPPIVVFRRQQMPPIRREGGSAGSRARCRAGRGRRRPWSNWARSPRCAETSRSPRKNPPVRRRTGSRKAGNSPRGRDACDWSRCRPAGPRAPRAARNRRWGPGWPHGVRAAWRPRRRRAASGSAAFAPPGRKPDETCCRQGGTDHKAVSHLLSPVRDKRKRTTAPILRRTAHAIQCYSQLLSPRGL